MKSGMMKRRKNCIYMNYYLDCRKLEMILKENTKETWFPLRKGISEKI